MAHATGGRDGRQEGCESGYYNLHRDLKNLLFHNSLHLITFECLMALECHWECLTGDCDTMCDISDVTLVPVPCVTFTCDA